MNPPILPYLNGQTSINCRFEDYLEGKTVAIVGRANLHQLEQGEFIDSHDVTVRTHSIIPYTPENQGSKQVFSHVPEEWKAIIGSRVDVLYHRMKYDPGRWLADKIVPPELEKHIETFYLQGGKFLCLEDPHPFPLRFLLPNLVTEIRYINPAICAHLTLALQKESHVEPGIVIIADILSHNIESAYITGFPCYFDKTREQRTDLSRWDEVQDVKELKFLWELSKLERVSFDPLMHDLFQVHCT